MLSQLSFQPFYCKSAFRPKVCSQTMKLHSCSLSSLSLGGCTLQPMLRLLETSKYPLLESFKIRSIPISLLLDLASNSRLKR